MKLTVPDESDMITLGGRLAAALPDSGLVITLRGDLGAGKTTLVRAMLRTLGVTGHVRSPTYTLVEPYDIGGRRAFHLDLYRVADPEELEFLGVRDLDPVNDLIFIEWPERGGQLLPAADLAVEIAVAEPRGREVKLLPVAPRGLSAVGGMRDIGADSLRGG
ncbi:MAG TPA: tRNA (adenosine(37)-N6)-threonylcarbamoyltransferase complex ATPase subunit type 1 TsaE [Gammaproteobacteria bacterium]|nr:tRNA (adenosine(37)-N6)-threonylcarbamoyltransferase complex ATPase subunit type 1 TsaE [Gammaproteobacteria bacterium]